MGLLGGGALAALHFGDGRASGLVGLVAGVTAAPGLLAVGAPLGGDDRYLLAIAASTPLWLLLGLIASRRATASTIASWRDYWRELVLLAVAVLIGAIGALIVASQLVGESLVL